MTSFFIVTTCRNQEKYIGRCIASVLEQSHQDWRMLIVSDCSNDQTEKVALEASKGDFRIKVVSNSERKYHLRSLVENVDRYSPHDSVIVELDGDDHLSDP